jgi:transposase
MFLRKVRPKGRGSKQIYWELVESYRTVKGSRQRTVAYLGKLGRRELNGWQKLSSRLNGQARPMPGLFEPIVDEGADVELVDLKNLRLQRMRNFGDVFLAWTLWRMLGLDMLLSERMPVGREEVPWATVAAILCLARFCRPCSELHIEKHFYPQSALEDLLGVEAAQVHTDRLYAGIDQLLVQKQAIEKHLRQRLGELFELSYDILLYDLTSTYFEGQCARNPQAKRGYSRDSRGDCPQVVIALIVTTEGYPLGYEVFAGNTQDSTTVQQVAKKVEEEHGKADRIWVMDRGNVSEANLAFLRDRGGKYIVGTPKAMLRKVQGEITEQGWQQVREGIQVKLLRWPASGGDAGHATESEPADTLVLCRSQDRVAKESAMLKRFVDRMEEGLKKLAKSTESGRLKDLDVANQRLGRLLEKNWRAAACFQVNITPIEAPAGKARVRVQWTRDEQSKQSLCGCYLLRTNLPDADPVALWRQYIQLVDAEWAFRITKDELQLRPIWHQNEKRVQGHILVCFLAYAMWKTLSGWMKAGGLGEAPRPLVEELSTIKSGDVILPTRTPDGTAGPTLVVRCVTRPDEHQAVLLQRLGMELPNQLARFRMEDPIAASAAV